MHECRIAAHAIRVRTAMLSLCSVLNFFDKQSGKTMTYVLDLQESIPLLIIQNVVERLTPIHMQSYEFFEDFNDIAW